MIHYDMLEDTWMGDLLIAATDVGLCALVFAARSETDAVDRVAARFPGERIERSAEKLAGSRREIEQYLAGERTRFTRPLDLGAVRGEFQRKVLELATGIPFGEVTSYGELAARAGSPGAARAVGAAMAGNPVPVVVPCHRVLESSGGLGGYTGGLDYKRKLLAHEGVELARQTELF